MRKTIAVLALLAAAGLGSAACSGAANADEPTSDQTVVVNQTNSVSSGSADCAPASLLAAFPWLPVPACS